MHLILAPLHGFTDATFRNVYYRHFGGIDKAIAPFISLTHGTKITTLKVRDVLPEVNLLKPVIPQILGNDSGDFIMLCRFLSDELGFKEVNWNLGCPINGIVKKKRGSGLLPHSELLNQLLSEIIPKISLELSVKLRLGLRSVDEFHRIAAVLNHYTIKNVIIHPRLGVQQYEGSVLLNEFEQVLPLLCHRVAYNGDIQNVESFTQIQDRFPLIDEYVLGRGVFYNPFLPEMIKSGSIELPPDYKLRFKAFYHELEGAEKQSRKQWMSKMKEYWKYYGKFLGLDEATLLQLMRCKTLHEWSVTVQEALGS